jgi:hypothetical protein
MTIRPFQSDKALIKYSRVLLRELVKNFRKDMAICLRRGGGSHAYFPALMTSIGFADFLSGLNSGTLEHQHLKELKAYAGRFMNSQNYDTLRLEILYEMFRHKLAHLGYLPVVFDTATKPNRFSGQPRRHITWGVYATRRKQPIEVEDLTTQQYLTRATYPWHVPYDCRVRISLQHLQIDIIKSIYGPSGYLRALEADSRLRNNFAVCMRYYFPP